MSLVHLHYNIHLLSNNIITTTATATVQFSVNSTDRVMSLVYLHYNIHLLSNNIITTTATVTVQFSVNSTDRVMSLVYLHYNIHLLSNNIITTTLTGMKEERKEGRKCLTVHSKYFVQRYGVMVYGVWCYYCMDIWFNNNMKRNQRDLFH